MDNPNKEFQAEYEQQDSNPETLHAQGTAEEAERSLRALKYWRYTKKNHEEHAHRQIELAERWLKQQSEETDKRIAYHEAVCKAHLVATKQKSVKLIAGTIKSRLGKDKLVFVEADGVTKDSNRELFIGWSKLHYPDLVETVTMEKVDSNKVLKAVKETGELFVGVDVVAGEISYSIELNQ